MTSQNPQFCQPASVSLQCKSGVSPGSLCSWLCSCGIFHAEPTLQPVPAPSPACIPHSEGREGRPLRLSREFTAPPAALEREEMGPVGLFTGS